MMQFRTPDSQKKPRAPRRTKEEIRLQAEQKAQQRKEKKAEAERIKKEKREAAELKKRERLAKAEEKARAEAAEARKKEFERLTALAEKNEFFVDRSDGIKERWAELIVSLPFRVVGRFTGHPSMQYDCAVRCAKYWCTQWPGRELKIHDQLSGFEEVWVDGKRQEVDILR